MKRIFYVVLVSFILGYNSQAQVSFIDNNWETAFAEARNTNKFVFVDCYTDWCSWCKVMDKNTFSNTEVGSNMSEKFVALKLNMEKGYGINVAMKYGVSAFPSYLVLNAEGYLIKKLMGYMEVQPFLQSLTSILENPTPINGYSNSIKTDYPLFYTYTFDGNKETPRPAAEEVYKYLDTQTDLLNETNFNILKRYQINEKYAQVILNQYDNYKQMYGDEANDLIEKVIDVKLETAIANKSLEQLALVVDLPHKYQLANASETEVNLKAQYYLGINDCDNYALTINQFVESQNEVMPATLNSYSWTVYEKCNSKKSIDLALVWIERALSKEEDYASMDTYAALLYKAKNYSKAKTIAEKAIKIGTADGEDVSETQKLLAKINAASIKK
ncbi:MAG: thioredoxin family protein [Bacteroidia bacterium]|nr:thioredoxin family protein [Bacteroidia bacterium]HQU99984.1 thioredoxin family protein [Bacteroidia bacterium]